MSSPPAFGAELGDECLSFDGFLLSWAEDTLREALSRSSVFGALPCEIFGQGSRVNGTTSEVGSDIDLVLMLNEGTTLEWEDFRNDVLAALGESYVVRMGRRCVNVEEPDSLFGEMVDILIATEYRFGDDHGVFFRDNAGRPIVNFPRQHRRSGDAKDLRTDGKFKHAVRSAKRIRRRAEQERVITPGAVPSYLLECLLYNVPDDAYNDSVGGALEWLSRYYSDDPIAFSRMPCQNGINLLFGPGPDQWKPQAAGRIVNILRRFENSRRV